jgi:hypothetical protein
MYQVPPQPKIYHILHVDRLASVLTAGGLWCDAEMQRRGGGGTTIGMSKIKQRRLTLHVKCHQGDYVGDYVPFYFCPRSIMLYLIYRANDPDLDYRGSQQAIIHLEADLYRVVQWANTSSRRWAFTLSNAGAVYAEFRSDLNQLDEINWPAVRATNWRSPDLKEGKQAEFLLHNFFPWDFIDQIGVSSQTMVHQVEGILQSASHRPVVAMRSGWYY